MDELAALGVASIAVTPQLAEHNRELIEQKRLAFEVLHDPGNEMARAWGLRWTLPGELRELYMKFGVDLAAYNGEESWTLPLPARYIIDTAGFVRYARVNADYTCRPEPEETIEALRRLSGDGPSVVTGAR